MTDATRLLREGHELASDFPALLAEAEELAASFTLGFHGRRRTGNGDEFWQYRRAEPGEPARFVDWRRSARSDTTYVREKEWQASQTIVFWVDSASSMEFSSSAELPSKSDRARLLSLAASLLLLRSGERVGVTPDCRPATGHVQEERIAQALATKGERAELNLPGPCKAVLLSDFLTDFTVLEQKVREATARNVSGILLQILDPVEVNFPFSGRAIFHSHGNTQVHETQKSEALKSSYLARLAELQDQLQRLARETGWQFHSHSTTERAFDALRWVYQSLEIRR